MFTMKIEISSFFFPVPDFLASLEIICVLGPAELIKFELCLELWCGESLKNTGIDTSDSPEAMPGSALHRFGKARRILARSLRGPRRRERL